jgi:malate dehydrogenase
MLALILSLAVGVVRCTESSGLQPALAPTAAVSGFKVTILGASGGIGMPLSMLMKMDEQVSELSLYDVVRTAGVAADISHICTNAKVCGFTGEDSLRASLAGSDMVVITAGVPRKPGMTR